MVSGQVESILDFGRGKQSNHTEEFQQTSDITKVSNFALANIAAPHTFLSTTFQASNAPEELHFSKGTTTLGFIFKGGVVIAVDSRATQGGFIASQSVQKVITITPYLLGTMAGGAADCSFWERELARRCRLYELQNKRRITVAAASKILNNITYSYKGYGLSMGTMIAGWDHTGPNLHYVDSDGSRLKGERFSVGSGSTYAYGVLDTGYRYDMSVEEACELGRRAIHHATHRDAASGGTVQVYLVQEQGWTRISGDDTNDLFYERYNVRQ